MRLLLDANLSPRVAEVLRINGHETMHVGDVDMLTAADEAILEWAAEHGYVVATADSDFGALLFRSRSASPSVVHLRGVSHRPPEAQAALLVAGLPTVAGALNAGAIVSLSPTSVRARDLPIW
ncbi:DUF5615 family PIN-like protein [Candidatus Poriferisodalis sp.]|uniref:DUF5615 family PIN-like protein n=1 Tax=Candidatus Poriferisodalis sp. TaxID=3101277 RepID=UPI003B026025